MIDIITVTPMGMFHIQFSHISNKLFMSKSLFPIFKVYLNSGYSLSWHKTRECAKHIKTLTLIPVNPYIAHYVHPCGHNGINEVGYTK